MVGSDTEDEGVVLDAEPVVDSEPFVDSGPAVGDGGVVDDDPTAGISFTASPGLTKKSVP